MKMKNLLIDNHNLEKENKELKELLIKIKDSCFWQYRFYWKWKDKKQLLKDFLTIYHEINRLEI